MNDTQPFLNTGLVVVNKETGVLGRCSYSSAGLSISGVNDQGQWQTIGGTRLEVGKHWRPASEEETERYFADCERFLNE